MQNNLQRPVHADGCEHHCGQTKSGTDTYHGDAWEFLRNTDLNATQYFSKTPTVIELGHLRI